VAGNCVTGQYKFYNHKRLLPATAPGESFPTKKHLFCSHQVAQISTASHPALFYGLVLTGARCPVQLRHPLLQFNAAFPFASVFPMGCPMCSMQNACQTVSFMPVA
jgi:hypothetical protein